MERQEEGDCDLIFAGTMQNDFCAVIIDDIEHHDAAGGFVFVTRAEVQARVRELQLVELLGA